MPSRGYASFFPGNTGRLNIPSSGIDEFLKGPSRSSLSSLSALGRLMSGAGYGGYGGGRATRLTAKEREELLNQSKMAQAQNAVFNNEEFRQRYQMAMQSSAAKAQQAVKDMQQAYIKPIASQFGVDAGRLSDIMMGQLSAETRQRVRDVKEDKLSYAGQKALHGLTNFFTTTLGNAIPYFRTESERDAASKRAIEESRAIDQNNAYGRDQLLRQQEGEGFLDLGSGETGSYLANMAEMIGENVPAIAATLTPAGIVGAAGNALRLGAAGLNALRTGALMGAGAGVGAAMSSEGFRQRVFSDPNLSPEQQRAALDSPEATANTALGAALGGIPFGAEGLWRMAAPRIPFTAAGRRVAADTAAQAAELTAARAAVPLAEREAVLDAGRRAALEAEAQRQTYQTMAPAFLSRAGQQARWMVPEVAAMNVGQTAGSNILYGGATGQDVPWTEGLGEAVASSIPLGLLGAGMSAASMGGRARSSFLRNFRDDGTPKITNAQLARTLNSRINNGTLGDVGTLDALRRFRADWGDEASFADVLAQVDPQYHDMLGKVYNLLGKSDITAADIAAAFGRRETPEAPIIDTGAPIEQGSPVIQTGTPIEQRPQLPVGTGRAAQDVIFAGEAPRGFREERVRQRPESEGSVRENLPVMRDGLPSGSDTTLPPRYEDPIPVGPAPTTPPARPTTSPAQPTTPPAAPVPTPSGTGRGKGRGKIMEAAQQAVDTVLPKPVPLPNTGQTSFVTFNTEQASPTIRRIADYVRSENRTISAAQILDSFINDMRTQKASTKQVKAHYATIKSLLEDITRNKGTKGSVAHVSVRPEVANFWSIIKSTLGSFKGDVTLKSLQKFRESLNEPKNPAGQSRTQGVGRNVTRGEAAGDAGDTATSGAVAPVARDADTQTAEPAAPADTTAGRTDESGRTGGAEAPDVRAGEVAVPAAEPDGTQPVGTRTDGGRGAEPAAEGTSAAGESTGVAPAAGSGSENIQQSAQGAGDGKAVKAKGAKQPAKPRGRRVTPEDSARVGEQVRQQVEADPALVPPANRVDEPAAPATETQDAPKVIVRRKGAKNKQKEVKAAEAPKTTEDTAIDDAVEKLLNLSNNIRKQHDKRILQQTVKDLEEQESISSSLGIREVYDVLSGARSNQNLTPAKLRAAVEKDLNLLYRVATEGEATLNKKQQAQYKELTSLLPEGATIDQSDIQAAIAYKTSAENDGMKISGGKALMNILGESNTTKDALDTKPTTICR